MTFRLSALFGLSALDWYLTTILLGMGATEANPLVAALFEFSPWAALAAKQLLIGACCYGLWKLKLHTIATLAALIYFAVVWYELGLIGR